LRDDTTVFIGLFSSVSRFKVKTRTYSIISQTEKMRNFSIKNPDFKNFNHRACSQLLQTNQQLNDLFSLHDHQTESKAGIFLCYCFSFHPTRCVDS